MRKLIMAAIPLLILALVVGVIGCSGGGGAPTPTDDWRESLVWMRENTPDPFQDPEFLDSYGPCAIPGQDYEYPESAYWVMSWWDYGCWIIDVGHRLPHCSSKDKDGARDAGLFFTAQDEASANEVLDRLGSKYVIIDYLMATGKFYAMIEWAGKDRDDFFEVYYQRQADKLTPVMVYYPSYYQSMCSRLYNSGGEGWVPQETWVISYTEELVTDTEGNRIKAKVISDVESFTNYDDAEAFVDANPSYKIVGTDRFTSPVPLEELEDYELIHKSPTPFYTRGNETISRVEIFEYVT